MRSSGQRLGAVALLVTSCTPLAGVT